MRYSLFSATNGEIRTRLDSCRADNMKTCDGIRRQEQEYSLEICACRSAFLPFSKQRSMMSIYGKRRGLYAPEKFDFVQEYVDDII